MINLIIFMGMKVKKAIPSYKKKADKFEISYD